MAVHNGEPYVRLALESILRQTVSNLELVVVDDGSTDGTPEILASMDDARLRVLRNEEQQGLATSLNRGLDEAHGRYVARLDADDVALPRRLERQLLRIRAAPAVAIVGSGVMELDDAGRVGAAHLMPAGPTAVRWAALFSSPFFHPSVLVDRDVLDGHSLRYEADFLESEDYDLWARLLEVADGDNIPAPLVLYRVHEGQASRRRSRLQREFQLRVAQREIMRVAPGLSPGQIELAWRVGAVERIAAGDLEAVVAAYLELVHDFERTWGRGARMLAARDLMRLAARSSGAARNRVLGQALRL